MSQLSCAIVTAIPASHPCHLFLQGILLELAKWDSRSICLRERAYEWCSTICKIYPDLEGGKELLFLSLEIGFRDLDFQHRTIDMRLVHTEHHQSMVDFVFNSGDDEVIADFLQAWTSTGDSYTSHESLGTCAPYLINLQHVASASERLQRLVKRSVELIDIQEFEQIGVGEFAGLLDHLSTGVNNTISHCKWLQLAHFLC